MSEVGLVLILITVQKGLSFVRKKKHWVGLGPALGWVFSGPKTHHQGFDRLVPPEQRLEALLALFGGGLGPAYPPGRCYPTHRGIGFSMFGNLKVSRDEEIGVPRRAKIFLGN